MRKVICLFLLLLLATGSLPAQDITGTYETDFKEMELSVDGNNVTGTYEHNDGRIEGTLDGYTLSGWWHQSNGKGRFIFHFNTDFSGFVGEWGNNEEEPHRQWNGMKSGLQEIAPLENFPGLYKTNFGVMTLHVDGNNVTGKYDYKDGRIEGTLDGTTLTGRWKQSNGEGRLIFEFNPAFTAFEGKWSYNDEEPSSNWSGEKTGFIRD